MQAIPAVILAFLILLPTAHAMTPGPDLIKYCPGVGTALRFVTIASGNTFGAIYWTDGKMHAPMLLDNPGIWKAGPEAVIFWEEDCELIETLHYGGAPNVPTVDPSPLDEDDFFRALDAGMGDTPEREEQLRRLTWWASNDKFRRAPDATLADRAPRAIANMEALFALLDGHRDESTRVGKAELARQLGDFDHAARLLAYPFSDAYLPAVARIRELIDARKVMVGEIRY